MKVSSSPTVFGQVAEIHASEEEPNEAAIFAFAKMTVTCLLPDTRKTQEIDAEEFQ